ncbi:MAG: hypothetical protein Kow0058_14990 [Roseovarius sp.]
MFRAAGLALTVLAGWAGAPGRGDAQAADAGAIFDVRARINPHLGLAFPGAETRYYDYLVDAGMGVVRINAEWKYLEPQSGRFVFRGLDRRIEAIQSRGMTAFVTFVSNADWATTESTQHLNNATPRDPELWSRFVRTVAERYDHDGIDDMPGLRAPVGYWQAANEFMSPKNKDGGWGGTNDELLAYVNLAHDAVKAASPEAVFVLGGVSVFTIDVALALNGADIVLQQEHSAGKVQRYGKADLNSAEVQDLYQNRFLRVIRESRYDYADVHLYELEERDAARIALMRQLSGRPVLSSECGGPALTYGGSYTGHRHYVAVIERNLNALAAGAPFCLWYGLGEREPPGSYMNARAQLYDLNRRPKPGVMAYRLLSRLLSEGAEIRTLGSGRGYEIRHGPGDSTLIALDRAAQAALVAAAPEAARAICIEDAERRQARLVPVAAVQGDCGPDAVVITGARALGLIGAN